jgi:hypothetical protein
MPSAIHPHMLRHASGYKLANDGHDTRALQHYARFGSYRKPMGVWGCFRIYRLSSMRCFRPRKM